MTTWTARLVGGPTLRRPAPTTEYVQAAVTMTAGTNPTGYPVAIAFTAPGTRPGTSDWRTGAWGTVTATPTPQYIARVLVGPAGPVTLVPGTWLVWCLVTDGSGAPAAAIGELTIT